MDRERSTLGHQELWALSVRTATHCNTLYNAHTATHCNTLQHTATHCNTRTLKSAKGRCTPSHFALQSHWHFRRITPIHILQSGARQLQRNCHIARNGRHQATHITRRHGIRPQPYIYVWIYIYEYVCRSGPDLSICDMKCVALNDTATRCNTLQRAATHLALR